MTEILYLLGAAAVFRSAIVLGTRMALDNYGNGLDGEDRFFIFMCSSVCALLWPFALGFFLLYLVGSGFMKNVERREMRRKEGRDGS